MRDMREGARVFLLTLAATYTQDTLHMSGRRPLPHPLFGTVSGHFRPETRVHSGPGVVHSELPGGQWIPPFQASVTSDLGVDYPVQAEQR